MGKAVFVINPGSTSTKIALFIGTECRFSKAVRHEPQEIKMFPSIISQVEYRLDTIKRAIFENGIDLKNVDAFAGRGGILRPLCGGTYFVNRGMLEDLKAARYGEHASNLGAIIAAGFSQEYGKAAFVVNPPVVDEMMEEARITGLPEIRRTSVFHALNHKAVAIRAAAEAGMEYGKARFIVAHLGGGISVGVHDLGRVIDVNNGLEEGPFSPERAGSLPGSQLVDMCFSGRYTREQIKRMLVGNGGLIAHTGTSDCIFLEDEAKKDAGIKLLLDAFVYRISREICAGAAALYGRVDRILITGGLAYSAFITESIKKRVSFLGTVAVYPGEDEMAALAQGVMSVLEGKEKTLEY